MEVLSTDRSADTIRKFAKYAQAGLERCWIIDPDGPVIVVYHLEGDVYVEQARHRPGTTVELDIGVAMLALDPADLLSRTDSLAQPPRIPPKAELTLEAL